MGDSEFYLMVFICIVAFILIFLLLRLVFCWYWKINYRVKLMEEQNEKLDKIIELLRKGQDYTNDI